jgi:glucokinase
MNSEANDPDRRAVMALDLGGTKLAAAVFTRNGKPRMSGAVTLGGREGAAVGELIAAEVRRLRSESEQQGLDVCSVGVSTPGIVKARGGRVWAPNIPGWEDFPLGAVIRKAIGSTAVKVVMESDRTASILGEAWHGAARGHRDAIFVAVGTGIGAGVLVDGRVLRGAHGAAGAIGWWALDRPFLPEYAACGCFESYASGEGLAKIFKATSRNSAAMTRDLYAAFESGNLAAKEVIDQAVEFWGMAAANLVSAFNPTIVVFGGGMFGPAAPMVDAIAAEARRWAQPISITQARFAASELGPLAALYGAGYLALRRAGFSRAELAAIGA